MAVIPTGFAQCNLFFVGSSVPRNAQIALGIDNNATLGAPALAGVVGGAWVTHIMPLLPEVLTLEGVKAKLGPNATGAESTISYGVPGGDDDAEPMPPNVAILVSKNTATGGIKNKGKIFVPAFPESDSSGGGYLLVARQTAWQTAMDAFLGALDTADSPMVVLHNDATAPTPVTDLLVQLRLATQKRRLRRAGGRRAVTP